jgi:alanine racemase
MSVLEYPEVALEESLRSWVEIDLSAIEHNVQSLQQHLGAKTRIMAVVKANGYGLGGPRIGAAALAAGASSLAVATCEEGLELRESGLSSCPILVLGYVPTGVLAYAIAANLTLTINDPETALALSQEAMRQHRRYSPLPVQLKLDTGLHRYGLDAEAALDMARYIQTLPGIQLQGLYTHFATGDEADRSFVYDQLKYYEITRDYLAAHGFEFAQEHLSNSASAITVPEARYGTARIGYSVLGYYPSPIVAQTSHEQGLHLRPCMTFKSKVVRVSHIRPGDGVGYNLTWIAKRPSLLALVPVGYADGYRRALSNQGEVLINGFRAPVVGRISMDQLTVDVTDRGQVYEGDEVVLIGKQGRAEITLDEVAAKCDTIGYEILTGLGSRVKRVYL